MAEFKVIMPKLGESIQEATITKWFIKEGDKVVEDDLLLEVATDKVDSEIPSPVEGKVLKILYPESTLLPVGEVIALIQLSDDDEEETESSPVASTSGSAAKEREEVMSDTASSEGEAVTSTGLRELSNRFYSPLVRKIAEEEKVTVRELESISGTGSGGRVQKRDILGYLASRSESGGTRQTPVPLVKPEAEMTAKTTSETTASQVPVTGKPRVQVSIGAEDQIIEMDRVRKLIADHMVMSKQVSPHVTSVVEADVTTLVLWRNKVKDQFLAKYGEKLTYMPAFIEATARALAEFPMVNASVDENRIILRKHINIGIAVAKPDGNLIVPVIKNAEEKNLVGITKSLNGLADAARRNKLSPDDIQGGSFSITNFGSFRNLIGTPIINQPQVAILATGSIEKKPAVLELPEGDVIAIRHKMFLSLSYDHRIVDGALGGAFLRRIADILEEFDINRPV